MADCSRAHGPGLKFYVAQLHSGSTAAVVNSLITIRTKFVRERVGIEKFRLHGGLKALVALIQKPNAKIVDISMSIIANCCTESETRKEYLVLPANSTKHFEAKLKDDHVQKLAIVLRRIAKKKTSGKMLVLKSVGVECIQKRAARALANLAQDKQNSEILHKAGTVLHLMELLKSGYDDDCLQIAIRAMKNLADSPPHRAAMVSQGAVAPLARLLKRDDHPGVVGACARALAELSRQCSAECAEVVARADALSTLVALVCSGGPAVRADAMQTLSSLCSQAIVRPSLGSAGAIICFIDGIRSAQSNGTTDSVTISSSTCTSTTTTCSSSGGDSCTSNTISATVSDTGSSVAPPGSAVPDLIRALCLCCREAVNRVKVVESGGTELLFSLLKDPHFKASHDRIIMAFLNFIYDESVLEELCRNGLVPILIRRLEEWTLVSDKFQPTAVADDAEDERYAASYDFPTEFNRKPDLEPNAESSSFLCMRSWLLTEGYIVSPGDIFPHWSPDGGAGDAEMEDLETVARYGSPDLLRACASDTDAAEEPRDPRAAHCSDGGGNSDGCLDVKRARRDRDVADVQRAKGVARERRWSEGENAVGARRQKRLLAHPQYQRFLKFCQNARSEAAAAKLKQEACPASAAAAARRASNPASPGAAARAAAKCKEKDARRTDSGAARKTPTREAAAAATAADEGPGGAASDPERAHGPGAEPPPATVGPDLAILWLLSRFSLCVDPSFLVTTAVLRGLLTYVLGAARPSPRAARILLRLAANPNCLEAFVRTRGLSTVHLRLCHGLCPDEETERMSRGGGGGGRTAGGAGGAVGGTGVEALVRRTATLKPTTPSNRELAWGMLRSLRIQAESWFGTGTLTHLLLTTRQGDKATCVLGLLYLCRNEPVRRKLLVDQCGLQLLVTHMLHSPDPNYVIRATGALLAFCGLEGKAGGGAAPSSPPPPTLAPLAPPADDLTSGKSCEPPGSEVGAASADEPFLPAPSPRDGGSPPCGYERCLADGATDVTFALDCGAKVPARRQLLASRSEVFGAMLQGHYSEAQQPCVAVRGATGAAFTLLMHHLHGCRLPACQELRAVRSLDRAPAPGSGEPAGDLPGSLLGELMALSNQFLLPDLKRELTEEVVGPRWLRADSLLAVYVFAERHCFPELCRRCLEFLVTAPLTVAQRSRGFWELSRAQCNVGKMEAALHSILLSYV